MSARKETHGWFSPGLLQPLVWLLLAVLTAFAIRYVPAWKNETLLFIVTGIAIIPLGGWSPQAEQNLSMAIAAVLFVSYLLSLVFSLITHKALFA